MDCLATATDSDIQSYYLRAREYAPRRAALYLLTHWFVRTAALMARCTRTSMRTTIPLWSLIQPAYSVSPVSMSPDRVPSSLRLAVALPGNAPLLAPCLKLSLVITVAVTSVRNVTPGPAYLPQPICTGEAATLTLILPRISLPPKVINQSLDLCCCKWGPASTITTVLNGTVDRTITAEFITSLGPLPVGAPALLRRAIGCTWRFGVRVSIVLTSQFGQCT